MNTKFTVDEHAADYTYPGASPDYFFNCMSICDEKGNQAAIIPMDNPDYESHLKLIAAAPELLEALQGAKHWHQGDKWRNSDDPTLRSAWQMQMNFIDAAIKKATE